MGPGGRKGDADTTRVEGTSQTYQGSSAGDVTHLTCRQLLVDLS